MRYRKTTFCFWYLILAGCCWGRTSSLPQHVINDVKSALLPLFGFKDRPNRIETKPEIPETLRKLYQKQNDFYWDTASFPLPGLRTESANTARSFTHVESPIDANFKHHHKFRLKFDISSIPKGERLKAAELQITRQLLDSDILDGNFKVRVLLHDITKRGRKGIHGPITRIIDSKMIDLRKNTTLSLDIEPAVVRWLQNPKQNFGVLIEIVDGKTKPKHLRLKRDTEDENWATKQPLLLTYTDDGKNKQKNGEGINRMRPRRAPRKPRKTDHCRRKPMYVNFSDVGWSDWIVAPLGYDAFYCNGVCEYPMAEHMNTTNHAIVQSLMNSARPGDVPKPCCVPTQLTSMSMLYVDSENKVILKNYKEMVVVGCGCR